MIDSNYKIGWQVACWCTLALGVCCLLAFIGVLSQETSIFTGFLIMSALSMGGIGVGNLLTSMSLTKANHHAAPMLKQAAIFMFIGAGLALIAYCMFGNTYSKFAQILMMLMLGGMSAMTFLYRGQFTSVLKQLCLAEGLAGIGILIYAISVAVFAFTLFLAICGVSYSACGIIFILAMLGESAGAALWFVTMLQIANKNK